jgi:large conductance mechanosensitive channel
VTVNYGRFKQPVVDFTFVAYAVFLLVKGVNRLRHQEEAAPPAPPAPSREEELLAEIRDLLKAERGGH